MHPFIIFDSKDFVSELQKIKKFWLHTRQNSLRIEAHKDTKTAEFYSINSDTGLETAFSIPVHVLEDVTIYVKNARRFHDAVMLMQDMNAGEGNSLKLRLHKSSSRSDLFSLSVLLESQEFVADFKPL